MLQVQWASWGLCSLAPLHKGHRCTCGHHNLLALPQAMQACFNLRPFALAVFSAWSALPSGFGMIVSLTLIQVTAQMDLFRKVFPVKNSIPFILSIFTLFSAFKWFIIDFIKACYLWNSLFSGPSLACIFHKGHLSCLSQSLQPSE